jgi:hypothetical protein
MGTFSLAKLDITSKTQKTWADILMISLYYNRGRHNVLQKWVAGDKPLTEYVQQGSYNATQLTLAEIMDSYSLVEQINWLYQYYIDLDAKHLADKYGTVNEWYETDADKLTMPSVEASESAFRLAQNASTA